MKRIFYLDIVRIGACLMIIAMHAPIPNTGLSSIVLSTDSFLTAPGIGLFVMVSGALLLPVNISTKQFLKKRFGKIAFPTLFWSIIYVIVYRYGKDMGDDELVCSMLSMPLSHQFGVMWFMYMLAGLYLFAPILSAWLMKATRKECRFYLCLWFVTLCYPLVRNVLIVNESNAGVFYYFSGYAGYFILGYYIKMYVRSESIWKILLLLFIPVFIAALLKILKIQVSFYDMFWYLSVFVVMMCVAWFLLAKRVNVVYNEAKRWHKTVVLISNCCFGIYLVHIFVMWSVIWNLSWLHVIGTIQIFIITFLTFIGSLVVTWLISHLPGAEYIIGFRQER